MRHLTKKERRKKKRKQAYYRKLLKKYPWLYPRHVWTGKKMKDYDYTFTELDCLPRGWVIAFGDMFLEELDAVLRKYNMVDTYLIEQVKEKYASMRWYDNGLPTEGHDVVRKYEHLSENICIACGRPDVPIVGGGWISPECYDCFRKRLKDHKPELSEDEIRAKYEELSEGEAKMCDSITVRRYSTDGTGDVVYDVSETAQKIRYKWSRRHD